MEVRRLDSGLIEMCFPCFAPEEIDNVPLALKNGLSISPVRYLRNRQAYFAVYDNEEDVRNVIPDFLVIKQLAPYDVVVTARGKDYDCVSRYFWPSSGGDEDPVTGSAHTGLAPYWAKQHQKNTLVALQVSKRSGVLYCRMEHDKVYISGSCVDYLQGHITV
ncbi:MAG: putative PhzF superfamily epimerase YddE/YHI9 [Lentisphaeria bacterium]|jgi:predicted PhzF superfamily epimerase YddE/YHI9